MSTAYNVGCMSRPVHSYNVNSEKQTVLILCTNYISIESQTIMHLAIGFGNQFQIATV